MSLLLDMARGAVFRKVADRVAKLDRTYVERWLACEFWLVDTLGPRYEADIRAWKELAGATMASITPEELLRACEEARPDLADLWATPAARAKLTEEWRRAQTFVRDL